jgi:hypothetical protein
MKTILDFQFPGVKTVDIHRHHPIPASFCAFVECAHSVFNPVFYCCRPVHNLWKVRADSQYFVASVLNGAFVRFRSFGSSAMSFGFSTRSGGRPKPYAPTADACFQGQRTDAVTPEPVKNLAEFLQATGWNCIYGIGMGTNTPARAAEEAVFVAETLGDRLQYFQIGNEPDRFSRRPGGDTGQAQGAGEGSGNAAGHQEGREVRLKVVCPRCVPAEKRGFQQVFYFVGVPDGI